jgi:hypothetical protein
MRTAPPLAMMIARGDLGAGINGKDAGLDSAQSE